MQTTIRIKCDKRILHFSGKLIVLFLFLLSSVPVVYAQSSKVKDIVQFIYTSDAHYGITRLDFRGNTNVKSATVNGAMIKEMNALPTLRLPLDSGIASGQQVAYIDYLIEGGDISNRMEIPVQSSATSWMEFEHDYDSGLSLKASNGKSTELLLLPGNHDISNAIGHPKPMNPETDPTCMVNIYNRMLKPTTALGKDTYDYARDKIHYSREIKGVHFMFVNLWPDSAERIWMEKDLASVSSKTPVIIFAHDQPEGEAKHFTNPVAPYQIMVTGKFENLNEEHYKEGVASGLADLGTDLEQRDWASFLVAHPNIKAYFHGNSNWNEFYLYHGPDHTLNLPVFRVDSPMKGRYSALNERLLSFQLISLDAKKQMLTVRECLWNTDPMHPKGIVFGKSRTISMK